VRSAPLSLNRRGDPPATKFCWNVHERPPGPHSASLEIASGAMLVPSSPNGDRAWPYRSRWSEASPRRRVRAREPALHLATYAQRRPHAERRPLHTAADILIIANAATPQSRVGRFVTMVRTMAAAMISARDVTSSSQARTVVIASKTSWHQPHPHAVKITDEASLTPLIVGLDQPRASCTRPRTSPALL